MSRNEPSPRRGTEIAKGMFGTGGVIIARTELIKVSSTSFEKVPTLHCRVPVSRRYRTNTGTLCIGVEGTPPPGV